MLEFLGSGVVLFASVYSVADKGSITGGLVGLSISYSFNVSTQRIVYTIPLVVTAILCNAVSI